MGNKQYSKAEHFKRIMADVPEADKKLWDTFTYKAAISCFVDRLLVVYKVDADQKPEVETLIKITDIEVSASLGVWATVQDLATGEERLITHTPQRLFGMSVYLYVPLDMEIRWLLQTYKKETFESLSFMLLARTRHNPKFKHSGAWYIETPNEFLRKYPGVQLDFSGKGLTKNEE